MRRFFPGSVLSRTVVMPLLLGPLLLGVVAGLVLAAMDGGRGAGGWGPVVLASAEGKGDPIADRTLVAARAALRGGTGHPSLSLTRLALRYPDLSAAERRLADTLLARPTDGAADPFLDGYAASARTRRSCTRHFCIHYVTSSRDAPPMRDRDDDGTPDWVERITRKVEVVWTREVDTLGYRPPAPDGARGGDARFDLYLAQLGDQGLYGYCPAERAVPGQDYVYSSYCVLDDDFAEFPLAPMPSFRVTLAHEFFHAIQYAYDAAEDPWLMEATATWMEEQVADDVNDNRQYLPHGQLGDPEVPLDQSPAGVAPYGNWVFFEALSTRYGEDAVLGVWRRADSRNGAPDRFSTQAVDGYLTHHSSSLRTFYAAFAAGNLAPRSVYPEARAGRYPSAPVAGTLTLKADKPRYSRSLLLDHLTSTTLALRPGSTLKGAYRLRLRLDLPAPARGAGAVVVVERADGTRARRPLELDAGGSAMVRANFRPGTVTRVLVTLTNASLRFSCWQDLSFSCQGVSRDDKISAYQVTAALLPPR